MTGEWEVFSGRGLQQKRTTASISVYQYFFEKFEKIRQNLAFTLVIYRRGQKEEAKTMMQTMAWTP